MHFHNWTLVRAEQGQVERFLDSMDLFDARIDKFNVTDLYYVCGRAFCQKTKIIREEGHWTMDELLTVKP